MRTEADDPIRPGFQRDRDRIIHTKAFRRLKHKTQVFFSPTGDHYRTRLTHTLEVAQIARTIAKVLHLNEELTEAIALGHDLGHTPFGHAGERVLSSLVSGGFTLFTARIAAMIGFNEDRANILDIANDKFAGTVTEPILGKQAKLATLKELTARFNLKRDETLAIGDGANDIPMIQGAGLGVAYHGKPAVAAAAPAQIDHGDLSALLYVQGYRRSEFVTPK